jgi:hypothetical protein
MVRACRAGCGCLLSPAEWPGWGDAATGPGLTEPAPRTGAAAGQPVGAPAAGAPAVAAGWAARASGPERIRAPQMIAPPA